MSTGPIDLLIVEDNPSDLELTLRILKKANVSKNLQVVKDGAEALDFLFCRGDYARRTFDQGPRVIFLDMKLPKMDGKEVLRQIKAHPKTHGIPVVMLTSSQQERDIAESYALGVNSYIVKPVDYEQFATALSQLSRYWLSLNLSAR